MSDANQSAETSQPAGRPRLWLWFVVGFVFTFVAMCFVTTYFYNGAVIVRTSVWRRYLMEIELAQNSSGNLGPTSDNAEAAWMFFGQHVLISLAAGAVLMSLRWLLGKLSKSA